MPVRSIILHLLQTRKHNHVAQVFLLVYLTSPRPFKYVQFVYVKLRALLILYPDERVSGAILLNFPSLFFTMKYRLFRLSILQ